MKTRPNQTSTRAHRNVGRKQLALDPVAYAAHKRLVGKRVVASGTLSGASIGHHPTPICLSVRTIQQRKQEQYARLRYL
jgi:hypothetical protein